MAAVVRWLQGLAHWQTAPLDRASRAGNRIVNLAGVVQGTTFVTFPTASSIFTNRAGL
jgi:hypothetical protein